jgi:cytosol alanyl aminopeptidase
VPRISLTLLLLPFALAAATVEGPNLRLDNTVVPTHYSVQLTVAPNSDTFDGAIDIDVTLKEARPIIWLNALELDLKSARVGTQDAKIIVGNKGFAGLELQQPADPGATTIHIGYSGKISRDSSAGIFQLQDNGRWYTYTQFESTDARRAFPCFDQPSFKTPWDIALKVPAGDKAFANSPEISSVRQAGGSRLVKFAATRPLPTYLVAFAVGPFDVVDIGKAGQHKTPLRIIVPNGHKGETEFSASAIPELLKLLEDYFGMPFPYAKLDSVIMPVSNFAMENVGLITYGADLLLSDPKKDSIARQRTCAIVAAHEMAHQWFGDLVTTAWWDDIWLNEAFATWMEGKIVERWRPEWHVDVDTADNMLNVMAQDRLATARKIRQPIESDNDIANAFDGITYQKGAAVIGMFEHWIGDERFRNGVRLYLRENADKSATVQQFLAALSKAGARDVAPAFSSFLDQNGTPVVSVALACDKGTPQVTLKQSRYVPIGSTARRSQLWSIPVCVRYESDGKVQSDCTLLTQAAGEIALTRAKACPAWVVGNDREEGYYRVEYQGKLLDQLIRTAAHELTAAETIGILSDQRALVDAGAVSPAAALSLVPAFAGQPQSQVVAGTMKIAGLAVSNRVVDQALPLGRQFILSNYAARAEQLGWRSQPGESDDRKLLRNTLVSFAVYDGHDRKLTEEAVRLARGWLKDHSTVDSNMIGHVLASASKSNEASLFDAYLAAAKAAKESNERRMLLGGLASFTDPALVQRAMGLLLAKQFDLREAFYPLLFGPLDERETDRLPFDFVRAHIDELLKLLPGEVGSDFAAALPGVGGPFCDASSRQQFDDFFRERVKGFTGGPRALAQVLERIDLCIQQKAQVGPAIEKYLRDHVTESR